MRLFYKPWIYVTISSGMNVFSVLAATLLSCAGAICLLVSPLVLAFPKKASLGALSALPFLFASAGCLYWAVCLVWPRHF